MGCLPSNFTRIPGLCNTHLPGRDSRHAFPGDNNFVVPSENGVVFPPPVGSPRISSCSHNFYARIAAFLVLAIAFTLSPRPTDAQQVQDVPTEEVVVNFAAGRVVIAVVKDAILIGTVENQIEPQTHPPIPVQMNRTRAGILLGAVDWFSPSSQLQLARLDTELPHLHGHFTAASPHLNQAQATAEATDLEALGQSLFERMNVVAGNLHGKIDWPSDRARRATDS